MNITLDNTDEGLHALAIIMAQLVREGIVGSATIKGDYIYVRLTGF